LELGKRLLGKAQNQLIFGELEDGRQLMVEFEESRRKEEK
jgi:hypothetical protein